MPRAKSESPKAPKPSQKIKIRKVINEPLLDERLLKKESGVFLRLVLTVFALALLIAGGAYLYFYFWPAPTPSLDRREIVVPPQTQEAPEAETDFQEPAVEEPRIEFVEVVILPTSVGFLNVRTGPGTGFEKIGEVKPGESYPMLSEDVEAGWYEIRFPDGTSGWVSGQYSEIKQ